MMSSAKVSLSLRLRVVGSADITSRTFRSFMLSSPASELHRQPKRNVAASVPWSKIPALDRLLAFCAHFARSNAALGDDEAQHCGFERATPFHTPEKRFRSIFGSIS